MQFHCQVMIFTDGSYDHWTKHMAWTIRAYNPRNSFFKPIITKGGKIEQESKSSSNYAELYAINEAIKLILIGHKDIDPLPGFKKFRKFAIITDSAYGIGILENSFDIKENYDMAKKIQDTMLQLRKTGNIIDIVKVEAHSNNPANIEVDQIAGLLNQSLVPMEHTYIHSVNVELILNAPEKCDRQGDWIGPTT